MKPRHHTVGLKELRTNLGTYLTRIHKGETFTVMRRSEPVFKIVPVDEEEQWETVVDCASMDKRGMSARDILKMLKQIDAKA